MIGRCRACGAPAAAADERELAPRDEPRIRRRPPTSGDYSQWLHQLSYADVVGAPAESEAPR